MTLQRLITGNLKAITVMFFAVFIFSVSQAQSTKRIEGRLADYMAAVKAKQEKPDLNDLLSVDKVHNSILDALEGYYSDTNYVTRLEAYRLTYTVGIKSVDLIVRQRVVDRITTGLSDENSSLISWSARHISVFNRADFTEQANNRIINAIVADIPRLEDLIKVAGYLKIQGSKSAIENYAVSSKETAVKWAAYVALSRMGDQNYTNRVVSAVRNQGLNDNTVYELVPDLIYTRQKACIDLAIEYMYEEKKLCTSSNPDNPQRMECGYRIMEFLAPVIQDFPYGVKTSGDIDTKDYPAALKKVREWFLSRGSDYIITDESF